MYCSTAPIVTVPWPDCSITQEPSQSRSWGQMRPQISGMLEVAVDSSHASRMSPSAARRSQSGMWLPKGQPEEQNGTPHCEHRLACASACFSWKPR